MEITTRKPALRKLARRNDQEAASEASGKTSRTLDDVRKSVPSVQKRNLGDPNDYFRTHEHFDDFAGAFGCEGVELGKFGPSLVLSVGERGAFALSKKSDSLYYRVCKFGKRKRTSRAFHLPHLYAIIHGIDPDKELSNVALLMWTRRLLHDAGICVVQRTKFRVPYDGVKKYFLSPRQVRDQEQGLEIAASETWPLAVAFLNGLGLRVDLEDDRTRFVPFTEQYALSWVAWEISGVSWRKAAQAILHVRQRLIEAGLAQYEKVGPTTSFFRPAPLDAGQSGMDARELLRLWA